MWKNQFGEMFETYDDARIDAEETLDFDDILRWIVDRYSARTVLDWLGDNHSASTILDWLGDNGIKPIMECVDEYFNENYSEVEE